MKVFLLLAFVLQILIICFAQTSIGNFHDSKYPGKCVLGRNKILDPGQYSNPDGSCRDMKCNVDGTIEFKTCHSVAKKVRPPLGCRLMEPDLGLDFPQCCQPIVQC